MSGHEFDSIGYPWRGGHITSECLADLINCNALSDGFRGVTDSVYKSGNDTVSSVHSAQVDINGQVRDAQIDLNRAIHTSHTGINSEVNRGFQFVGGEISDFAKQAFKEFCEVRKDICDVKHEVAVSTKDILLETTKSESRTREELLKGFHLTQLDACKNKDELSRQIAECCCDLKSLVKEEVCKTRELLLAQEVKTKDQELANLRLQLLVNSKP